MNFSQFSAVETISDQEVLIGPVEKEQIKDPSLCNSSSAWNQENDLDR